MRNRIKQNLKALSFATEPFCSPRIYLLRQGVGDSAESIPDLGSQQAHNRDHDNGDESENDRIFHESLTFFLRCK